MSLDAQGLPAGPSRLLGAATFPSWCDTMEEYFLLADLWAVVQGTEAEPYASDSKWSRSVRAGLVEPALPAAESLPRGTSTDTRVRNELLLVQQRAQWLDWRKREHLAQGAILRAVASPDIKERLKTYSRASDMWAHLVATYSARKFTTTAHAHPALAA
ncbi:uncharacterized protein LOC62_06G008658 [Vanrija pseudolonga]|uniref:DUF4219 domain-containing protein n=1 Tax=Vanrija pseudolonga TaxID=143232 RepID=A0AAF0YEB5_9TREE|nr:hypothetical protein LOC62_06G008658 [Vanrija pseudolonga]